MIALRRMIERGVRHPVLGPLCLILLALLLAFTVVHGAHDQIHEGELIVCIAILITAVVSLLLPRLVAVRVVVLPASRAPPTLWFAARAPSPSQALTAPIPLRL